MMYVYFVDAAFCSSSSILDSYTNGLKHAYRVVRLEKSHGIDVGARVSVRAGLFVLRCFVE